METQGAAVRSIYYGRIGSKVTERLLEMFGRDGSFLLRDSETVPGAYCLCVRKAPFVHTYRLERDGGGWYLQQDLRGRLLRFGTVESLLDHYRSHPTCHQSVAPLTLPLDRTTVPRNWFQGPVYMEMNGGGGQSGQ